jgi:5-methylcytosine-specific restriction endonuclease McrA
MSRKKQIRNAFRSAVFDRDGDACAMCGAGKRWPTPLDAHHIIDRNLMPNGGYVVENGISLCDACHLKAEEFHSTGTPHLGYSPEELFAKIGSDEAKARAASEKLE